MKKLFTFLMLFIASFSFAQDCKYEKNEVDKFTKKMTKVTKKVKLIQTFNSEGYVYITKEDTSLSISLNYRTSFSKSVKVEDGSELSFLLEGGDIITLKKKNGSYPISKENLTKLSSTKTKTLRYYYTDSDGNYKYSDTEIKDGNAEDFMKLTLCVL